MKFIQAQTKIDLYINNIKKDDNINFINNNYIYWIYNTGAAKHITNIKNILKNFYKYENNVKMC